LEFPPAANSSKLENLRPGAKCLLPRLLLEAANKYHGIEMFRTFISSENGRDPTQLPIDDTTLTCPCPYGIQFESDYYEELSQLKTLLDVFNRTIREQLLVWFFGRHVSGNQFLRSVCGSGGEPEQLFPRDDVDEIHRDYSKLYYPQKAKRCPCHGVCYTTD
jgi:hypothetical protein